MRRGLSLVEALFAAVVIGLLAVTVYELMIGTVRGVAADRLTETKRHLVVDLVEKYAHARTDIKGLFDASARAPYSRKLTVDETLAIVAVPDALRPDMKNVLATGGITGFNVLWEPHLEAGLGAPAAALRLDRIWVNAVGAQGAGPEVSAFRVFYVRGES